MTDTSVPSWWLYLLDCDGRLYTGISTDPARRLLQHQRGRGARFTRAARQVSLHWQCLVGPKGLALQAEYRLRRLPRAEKLAFAREISDPAALLARLGLN